jgi:hypothetical protein
LNDHPFKAGDQNSTVVALTGVKKSHCRLTFSASVGTIFSLEETVYYYNFATLYELSPLAGLDSTPELRGNVSISISKELKRVLYWKGSMVTSRLSFQNILLNTGYEAAKWTFQPILKRKALCY